MPRAKRSSKIAVDSERVLDGLVRREVFVGFIIEVLRDGCVILENQGARIPCRCAQGIDLGWLRDAVSVAPVEADVRLTANVHAADERASDEQASDEPQGRVSAIYPGPEHHGVISKQVTLAASESLLLLCGRSSVRLDADGTAALRGESTTVRGAKVARVRGGSVRLR